MPSLTVDRYPIAYAEAGTGEPLLLVHGTLGDQRSFGPNMAGLATRYRVLALSMRHCWPGRWEEGGDFTIARHVADVAGFIRALGSGPVRLLGHSRGGHIAFRVAELHPGLVRALVLAEPGGELDASLGGQAGGAQRGAFAEGAALVASGAVEAGLARIAAHTGGTGAWERRPEHRRQISRDNAHTLLGQVHEQRAPYGRASVEAIATPTLLLGGDRSQPGFGRILDALVAHLPRAERETIADAAHGLNHDNPVAFDAAVLRFLARH